MRITLARFILLAALTACSVTTAEASTALRFGKMADGSGKSVSDAVIVVDMAETEGGKVFLLAQSYMPAQEVHVLRNPQDAGASPWYDLDIGDELKTPEWTFKPDALKRFPQ